MTKVNKILLGIVFVLLVVGYFSFKHLNKVNRQLIKTQIEIEKDKDSLSSQLAKLFFNESERIVVVNDLTAENVKLKADLKRPPEIKIVYKEKIITVIKKKECDKELDKRDVVIANDAITIESLKASRYEISLALTACLNLNEKYDGQNEDLIGSKSNKTLLIGVGIVIGGAITYYLMRRK